MNVVQVGEQVSRMSHEIQLKAPHFPSPMRVQVVADLLYNQFEHTDDGLIERYHLVTIDSDDAGQWGWKGRR